MSAADPTLRRRPSWREYAWPAAHAGLLWQLAERDVQARYRQSWLGMSWVVLTPLLMLAIYVFVLGQVLQVRWPGAATTGAGAQAGFALRVYAGLAVIGFISECVGRAPGLVAAQPQLVKKVVFPLGLLAWVNVVASLVPLGVAALLLLLLTLVQPGPWPPQALLLPLAWLPLVPLGLGVSWLLAATGAYVRDVGHVAALAMGVLLFVSPIFYPLQSLPAALQPWLRLNPLALPIELTRAVVGSGPWPGAPEIALHLLGSLLFAAASAWLFHRLRPGFADVV
jgi:lipopolysaccharide transport system permease protein